MQTTLECTLLPKCAFVVFGAGKFESLRLSQTERNVTAEFMMWVKVSHYYVLLWADWVDGLYYRIE